jgi:hypothetical protein
MKTVAVVVPFYKENLNDDEKISLRHLNHFLGEFDRILVFPDNISVPTDFSGFTILRFDNKCFTSIKAYALLVTSAFFYDCFNDYEYILIYQLDSLVFSNDLIAWCKKGFDYIGAPILLKNPDAKKPFYIGNGGFCLRKVSSCKKIIQTYNNFWYTLKRTVKNFFFISSRFKKAFLVSHSPSKMLSFLLQAPRFVREDYWEHEPLHLDDLFWSLEAKCYYPDFKIADEKNAISFSFDEAPRMFFALNDNKLPFGCHAWQRYDREFWKPYLLK